ncbi:dihydroxyacetone kinase 1 [Pholiota conissans]|uniref:Dihydroxyacetone kinase 1 n=1 Tax=Pholiota conissans TaxID=109636 RepID=A0A9P5Z7U4_9AGAR|nr:dihydroxyacetone kinase 1 [Pholiota conissans]
MCGGGSGHEPAHAGYVVKGILAGAVAGNVFASPSATQVGRGIELLDNDKGTVIIVKNYTGDVLNFGLAKEQYAAQHPEKSKRIKFVIVGDDVAVGREQGKIVGRRGLAGTVLVYKIAGALADRGGSLEEVYFMSEWVAGRLATIGVSLGHTHVPGTASASSELISSEIEIGMGIHNESGHSRLSPIPKLSELVPQLLDFLTSTTDDDRSFVPFKGNDHVVALVNNLGGLSELELSGIVAEVRKELDTRNFKIHRILAGTFMTSLNMSGFSLTLLLLPAGGEKDAPELNTILSLLDDKSEAPGWKWSSASTPLPISVQIAPQQEKIVKASHGRIFAENPRDFVDSVTRSAHGLIKAEPDITRMDSVAGDGDCGLTLKAGSEGVLTKISAGDITGNDIVRSIIVISQVAEEVMGGTSGALYSIFFSGLAQGLQASLPNGGEANPDVWSHALSTALANLYTYTRARPPSRTLVDPLSAFVEALAKADNDIAAAVFAASKAAEATKDLVAKAGRSAYLEGDRLQKEQVADPGAWGVKVILENLA